MITLELVRRAFAAQLRSGLVWIAVLVLLTLSVMATWPAMQDSGALDQITEALPADLIQALGLSGFATPEGYLNGNLYALLLPALAGVLGVMQVTALTAGDEDAGRLELLLALPVGRVQVFATRLVAVLIVLSLAVGFVGATVLGSASAFDMDLDVGGVVGATLAVLALGALHAALAFGLAAAGLRAPIVLALSLGVLVLGYLAFALLPLVGAPDAVQAITPWYWAFGHEPLTEGVDWPGLALLAGTGLVVAIAGSIVLPRRTIRSV